MGYDQHSPALGLQVSKVLQVFQSPPSSLRTNGPMAIYTAWYVYKHASAAVIKVESDVIFACSEFGPAGSPMHPSYTAVGSRTAQLPKSDPASHMC